MAPSTPRGEYFARGRPRRCGDPSSDGGRPGRTPVRQGGRLGVSGLSTRGSFAQGGPNGDVHVAWWTGKEGERASTTPARPTAEVPRCAADRDRRAGQAGARAARALAASGWTWPGTTPSARCWDPGALRRGGKRFSPGDLPAIREWRRPFRARPQGIRRGAEPDGRPSTGESSHPWRT